MGSYAILLGYVSVDYRTNLIQKQYSIQNISRAATRSKTRSCPELLKEDSLESSSAARSLPRSQILQTRAGLCVYLEVRHPHHLLLIRCSKALGEFFVNRL